jgi:hypothetical protein
MLVSNYLAQSMEFRRNNKKTLKYYFLANQTMDSRTQYLLRKYDAAVEFVVVVVELNYASTLLG